jgi:hypothetical protein
MECVAVVSTCLACNYVLQVTLFVLASVVVVCDSYQQAADHFYLAAEVRVCLLLRCHIKLCHVTLAGHSVYI